MNGIVGITAIAYVLNLLFPPKYVSQIYALILPAGNILNNSIASYSE